VIAEQLRKKICSSSKGKKRKGIITFKLGQGEKRERRGAAKAAGRKKNEPA